MHGAGCLTLVGLGGAYHSALEVGGREYAFGGHFSDSLGIMGLQRPLFRLRQEAAEAVQAGEGEHGGGKGVGREGREVWGAGRVGNRAEGVRCGRVEASGCMRSRTVL